VELVPYAPAPPAGGTAGPFFAAFYAELHHLARCHVLRSARDLSLSATGLLHEAYLDMAPRENRFADRERFLAYASRVMHARIVDHARRRRTLKRGCAVVVGPLEREPAAPPAGPADGTPLRSALDGLAAADPLLADIVDLHCVGGFTHAEIAARKGLSERTVQRLWQRARAHLRSAVRRSED
jgi:RNA polymerase sigma factor (TIGR02999 family)